MCLHIRLWAILLGGLLCRWCSAGLWPSAKEKGFLHKLVSPLFLFQVGEKCLSGKILAGSSPIFFPKLNNSRMRSFHSDDKPLALMSERHHTAPPAKRPIVSLTANPWRPFSPSLPTYRPSLPRLKTNIKQNPFSIRSLKGNFCM